MASPTRRRLTQAERVAESTKRLMDATVELIAEQGFERTSTAQIAERAGYARSMVATRYGSKDELLQEVMRSTFDDLMLPDLGESRGIDRLIQWIDAVRDQAIEHQQRLRAFYTVLFEAGGPIPQLRPWSEDWMERCVREATDALEDARRRGEIPADTRIESDATRFVFSGVGLAFRYLVTNDLAGWEEGLGHWREHFDRLRI